MPQRPAQPIPTIQPTAKADTFSSSTADKSGFDDMLGDVTYEMVSLEEPVPGLLHAVFDVKNFYFADRIDRYRKGNAFGRKAHKFASGQFVHQIGQD